MKTEPVRRSAAMTYRRLPINGASIHTVARGSGDAVVFLHGYSYDSTTWEGQLNEFGITHLAIAYDYRGFGRSNRPGKGYSFPAFVDDLTGVLDAFEVERAVLCGLSFGVLMALHTALRRPDRVAGLLLADASAEGISDAVRLAMARRLGSLAANGPQPERVISSMYSAGYLENDPTVLPRFVEKYARNDMEGLLAGLVMLMTAPDIRDQFPSISVPVAVVAGEHDHSTPGGGPQRLAASIPGATFTMIPGAGHVTNEEQPEAFNAALHVLLRRMKTTR